MTLTAILLVILSAVMHAGWNYLGKRTAPSPAAFLLSISFAFLLICPILLFFIPELQRIPWHIWGLLVLSSGCQAIYYYFLSLAYREGDMSVMYPIARALPVLMVPPLVWLLGQGISLPEIDWLAILLIVAGCLLLPMQTFKDISIHHYRNKTTVFALLAAVGTTGYSVIDSTALKILRHQMNHAQTEFSTAILYIILQAGGSVIWLLFLVLPQTVERAQIAHLYRHHKWSLLLTGFTVYLTYGLVLAAMGFSEDVSYIVALRQTSIPLGALMAVWLLKETSSLPKWVGIALTLTGLTIISL